MINPNEFGSAPVGSPNAPAINPNNPGGAAGQANDGAQVDYKTQYEELEKKLGAQGSELGEYRTFFQNISPLLDKLDQSPELVQAIIDGKVDANLAKAAYEGKISIADAAAVSQAATEVKKDLGSEYKGMSPEEINKLIENKANEIRKEFEEKADLSEFEEKTQRFIASKTDFVEHAPAIDKWLDEHDVTDVEVAYWAVKGKLSEAAATKKAEEEAGEQQKDMMMNAAGGGVTARYAPDGTSIIDKLVAGKANPNVF